MYDWQAGWREALISDLGVDRSDFLMSVFQAWQESTPLQPFTNNPLGMPFVRGSVPELLNSGYGLFSDMAQFRQSFAGYVHGPYGAGLKSALLTGESLGKAYRAIRALDWPGNRTETDYPSAVLDLMTANVRARLQTAQPADRKTAGTIGYTSAQGGGMGLVGNALQRAANAALGGSNALRNYRKG